MPFPRSLALAVFLSIAQSETAFSQQIGDFSIGGLVSGVAPFGQNDARRLFKGEVSDGGFDIAQEPYFNPFEMSNGAVAAFRKQIWTDREGHAFHPKRPIPGTQSGQRYGDLSPRFPTAFAADISTFGWRESDGNVAASSTGGWFHYCEGKHLLCGGGVTSPVPVTPLNPNKPKSASMVHMSIAGKPHFAQAFTRFGSGINDTGYCASDQRGLPYLCKGDATGPLDLVPFAAEVDMTTMASVAAATAPQLPHQIANGFPAIVGIEMLDARICTGVLISSRVVATAAHCLCEMAPRRAWIGNSMTADSEYRSGLNVSREFSGEVDFFEENFCETGAGIDLAVAHLRNGSRISNTFFHEALPNGDEVLHFFAGKIVGFGASEGSLIGGVKRHADLEVNACSQDHVDRHEDCKPGREWISASSDGVDTCYGDSGGPLYAYGEQGGLQLVGLTTRQRGASAVDHCGDGGIYTNLVQSDVLNWLTTFTKGE